MKRKVTPSASDRSVGHRPLSRQTRSARWEHATASTLVWLTLAMVGCVSEGRVGDPHSESHRGTPSDADAESTRTAPESTAAELASTAELPSTSSRLSSEAAGPSPREETHSARCLDRDLPGFEPVLVCLPEHREPLSVVVVAHGAGGRAEEHVATWSGWLSQSFALVGLRGTRLRATEPEGGHYFATHHELRDELVAAVRTVREDPSLAAHLEGFPWTFIGYSQGATMGALALASSGDWFDRALFIEGGTDGWNVARSLEFARKGGRRLAWVCGTGGCQSAARGARSAATRAGLEARLVWVPGGGHTYRGRVGEGARNAWEWLHRDSEAIPDAQ